MQTAAAHTDIEVQLESVARELESRPNEYSLYVVRGELRRHSRDWLGAEADFARADQLGTAKDREQLRLYRGRLFEAAGQFRRAVAELDRFIDHHPDHIDAIRIRALAYAQMGAITEAISDYTRLIALNPARSPELWLERARLWVDIGHVDAAIASIDEAIVIFGQLVTLVEFAVDTEVGHQDYAEAFNRVKDLPPALAESPRWLWRRGMLLEKLDRPEDAALLYARAREAILKLSQYRQNTAAIQELLAKLQPQK